MTNTKKFKVGDLVKWRSQSAGVLKEKHGIVKQVIKAGSYPDKDKYSSLFNKSGGSREEVSYVVAVEVGKTAGSSIKHYWPLTKHLEAEKNETRTRVLKGIKRVVEELDSPVGITINTKCPKKWVFVDMETGDMWGHNGKNIKRIEHQDALVVSRICKEFSKASGK